MVGTRIPFHKFLSLYRPTMPEKLIFLAEKLQQQCKSLRDFKINFEKLFLVHCM